MFLTFVAFVNTYVTSTAWAVLLAFVLFWVIVAILAILLNLILKRFLVRMVQALIQRGKSRWAKQLTQHRVLVRLSHLGPALLIDWAANIPIDTAFQWTTQVASAIGVVAQVYITLAIVWFISALLDATYAYCQTLSYFKSHNLRSYLQILKMLLWFIAAILVISELFDKSPLAFITGLGALSAVLLLVFKDTILGFVTNIQVAAYDLVRVGDWITLPSLNVDGDVMEVSVNTVKIRNFDKTITTIPTYELINNTMQNWRGMIETGGRRIKRSLNIDLDTIHFCDNALLAQLSQLHCLEAYIQEKTEEIKTHNEALGVDTRIAANGRNLTNIGMFRAYVRAYLQKHPKIRSDLTFLVRHLQPTETGLPLEIYVFTNDTDWGHYEDIQADIFDHLFAALPLFQLRAFQTVTGRLA